MTILGVVSGSGGAGCSTLAAALGVQAAALGGTAVVVDGDPVCGGLQVTTGVEHLPGHRWAELAEVDGVVDGSRLRERLPQADGCAVLSGGRVSSTLTALSPEPVPPTAFDAVLDGLERSCDLVVVDWGRQLRPGQGASLYLLPLTARGIADAQAWLAQFDAEQLAGVVTRSRRGRRQLAEAAAAGLGLPLLGEVVDDRRVAVAERRGGMPGAGRGPLARLARNIVGAVVQAEQARTGRADRVPRGRRRVATGRA